MNTRYKLQGYNNIYYSGIEMNNYSISIEKFFIKLILYKLYFRCRISIYLFFSICKIFRIKKNYKTQI